MSQQLKIREALTEIFSMSMASKHATLYSRPKHKVSSMHAHCLWG